MWILGFFGQVTLGTGTTLGLLGLAYRMDPGPQPFFLLYTVNFLCML